MGVRVYRGWEGGWVNRQGVSRRTPARPTPAPRIPAPYAPPPMPVIHPPPRSQLATVALALAASGSPAAGPVANGSNGSPALPAVVTPPPPPPANGSAKASAPLPPLGAPVAPPLPPLLVVALGPKGSAWARRRPAKPANGSLKVSKLCGAGCGAWLQGRGAATRAVMHRLAGAAGIQLALGTRPALAAHMRALRGPSSPRSQSRTAGRRR